MAGYASFAPQRKTILLITPLGSLAVRPALTGARNRHMGGIQAVTDKIEELFMQAAAGGPGAPAAMSAFYEHMNGTIHGWVRQYIRDPHTAEDLAQEVWLKISQNIGRYQPGTQLMSWLFTITRNTAFDHLRAAGRRPAEVLHSDHLQLDRPRPGLSVEEQTEHRQLAEAVASRMQQLRPDQRTCLRLRFFNGHTSAHTAQIMGKTEGAVRTLTLRSLRRLAQVLPEGNSSTELVEELLTIAASRGHVVGIRVETWERASHARTR